MPRWAIVLGLVALALVGLCAWDVARQYPGDGMAIAAGTVLLLAFAVAYGAPVLVLLGLVAVEAYALWHVWRRGTRTAWQRVGWSAAILALTPWLAAGAFLYLAVGRRSAPAGPAGG